MAQCGRLRERARGPIHALSAECDPAEEDQREHTHRRDVLFGNVKL